MFLEVSLHRLHGLKDRILATFRPITSIQAIHPVSIPSDASDTGHLTHENLNRSSALCGFGTEIVLPVKLMAVSVKGPSLGFQGRRRTCTEMGVVCGGSILESGMLES
jgi:hypothetical protein